MNLRFVYAEDVTLIYNGKKLVLVVVPANFKNKFAFYRKVAWGLKYQASLVIDTTMEEFVTKLLSEVR